MDIAQPGGMGKKPLTIDEVLSARMVSYPLTVRDCCLITDGGGAVIMTTDEGARSLKKNRRSMSSAAARRLLMPVFRACPI
jgi:acetyl-CoA acetyltransferase